MTHEEKMAAIDSGYNTLLSETNESFQKEESAFDYFRSEINTAMEKGDKQKVLDLINQQMGVIHSFEQERHDMACKCACHIAEITGV